MSDQTAAWLEQQIAAHAPEGTDDAEAVFQLVVACAALAGIEAQAFGLALPAELPGKEALRQRWLPAGAKSSAPGSRLPPPGSSSGAPSWVRPALRRASTDP